MILLKLLEVFFVILYLGFLISEVIIPMSRSLPLFPSFREKKDDATEKTKNKKGE